MAVHRKLSSKKLVFPKFEHEKKADHLASNYLLEFQFLRKCDHPNDIFSGKEWILYSGFKYDLFFGRDCDFLYLLSFYYS